MFLSVRAAHAAQEGVGRGLLFLESFHPPVEEAACIPALYQEQTQADKVREHTMKLEDSTQLAFLTERPLVCTEGPEVLKSTHVDWCHRAAHEGMHAATVAACMNESPQGRICCHLDDCAHWLPQCMPLSFRACIRCCPCLMFVYILL